MAKTSLDVEIVPPNGGTSSGFTSVHQAHSRTGVSGTGDGVEIFVERDEVDIVPAARLTLEEGWMLYTQLRGMFYKTSEAEYAEYNRRYGKPYPGRD